jgi:glycine cleavage system H protein
MPADCTFLMGKFPAHLPGDLLYARNHMWARQLDSGRLRFGFTAYAVRLLQDVYFLRWDIDPGDAVSLMQEIGFIESSKAESSLYVPVAGLVENFNPALLEDPSGINVDAYGVGWLFEMSATPTELMDVTGYEAFLQTAWEKTQRVIKGKINEG